MQELDGLYHRFKEKAEAVSVEVYRVAELNKINSLIADILSRFKVKKVVMQASGLSEGSKLEQFMTEVGFEVHTTNFRREAPTADAGISQLDIAVAETGSLAQDATNVDSRLVSSLPLVHIALVPTAGLTPSIEDALARLYNHGNVPGHISFITGASRTSDIERVLTIGVHGPEKLAVVFVDEGGTD